MKFVILVLLSQRDIEGSLTFIKEDLNKLELNGWIPRIYSLPELDIKEHSEIIPLDTLYTGKNFSDIVLTKHFYTSFEEDDVLLFFQPTALIMKLKILEEFIEYDLVIPRRIIEGRNINGVFMVKTGIMKMLLTNYSNEDTQLNYWEYLTDPEYINILKLPQNEQRLRFSVESVYSPESFCVVQPWGYTDLDDSGNKVIYEWNYTRFLMSSNKSIMKLYIRQFPLNYYERIVECMKNSEQNIHEMSYIDFVSKYFNEKEEESPEETKPSEMDAIINYLKNPSPSDKPKVNDLLSMMSSGMSAEEIFSSLSHKYPELTQGN